MAPANPEGFIRRLIDAGLRIRVLAHEAGPTGFGLARACEAAGIAVIVAARAAPRGQWWPAQRPIGSTA